MRFAGGSCRSEERARVTAVLTDQLMARRLSSAARPKDCCFDQSKRQKRAGVDWGVESLIMPHATIGRVMKLGKDLLEAAPLNEARGLCDGGRLSAGLSSAVTLFYVRRYNQTVASSFRRDAF